MASLDCLYMLEVLNDVLKRYLSDNDNTKTK